MIANSIHRHSRRRNHYPATLLPYSIPLNLHSTSVLRQSLLQAQQWFYVVMMGLGLNSDLLMIGYSLILAMNYLPGMAVITLNVIGDAATNVIVCAKEHCLNKEIYNSKTPKNN